MIIVDERERKRKNATNTMEHASTGEQGESFPCLLPSSPPSPTSAQFLFGPRFVPFPTNQLVTFFFHYTVPPRASLTLVGPPDSVHVDATSLCFRTKTASSLPFMSTFFPFLLLLFCSILASCLH